MSLKEYTRKRNFQRTAEPKGDRGKGGAGHRFVIQKHAASRLHYDFRLEVDGTLKSWAVPKGVPFQKGERRLAVQVEDHPVAYINFEGTIPQGQYGGGTVMVWDAGTFEPLGKSPAKELAGGKLHFMLQGKKLQGEWYLVRLKEGHEWLLIKGGEDMKPVSEKADNTSALSGQTMQMLAKGGGRVWHSSGGGAGDKKATPKREKPVVKKRTARSKVMAKRTALNPSTKQGSRGSGRSLTPKFIEPMKALLVETPPNGEWLYEIKFDGFRAMAFRDRNGARLLSRNNNDFADKFPEIFEAISALKVDNVVMDGEIVALDDKGRSSFQLLQAFNLGEKQPPVLFYAFDLLQLNGEDLQRLPLTERRAKLEALLQGAPPVIRFSTSLGGDPAPLLDQAREVGLEGLIGKRPDSLYESGQRSGNWIKLKLHHEQEFVIGGYTPPGGSRPYFGALLVGVHRRGKLKFAGKVGTGFNAKLLQSLHARFKRIATEECPFTDLPEERRGRYAQRVTAAEMRRCHWVKPSLVCQLKFTEWTRDERLRHPVFLGLREDKSAREVVREKTT